MAACGRLEHIFDTPLPESSALIESLTPWKHIKAIGATTSSSSSFTDLLGELHFNQTNNNADVHVLPSEPLSAWLPSTPSSLSSNPLFGIQDDSKSSSNTDRELNDRFTASGHRKLHSFSSMNSDGLSLCTEGLGFESFDDVEDLLNSNSVYDDRKWKHGGEEDSRNSNSLRNSVSRRLRTSREAFPPPISCIGRNGKPWVCFKSYRQDGRFILKEVRIPTQEFLHACREDGRLRLQFMLESDDEILEHDDEEDEQEDNVNEGNGDSNN